MRYLSGNRILLLLAALIQAGCGGESSDSSSKTNQIIVSVGTGGSVTPESLQVSDGATAAFTVSPDAGYSIDEEVGGTCPAGSWSGNIYTTGPVTGACMVDFGFVPGFVSVVKHTITASVVTGAGGSVIPGSLQVSDGATAAFTVSPDAGYIIDEIVGGTCPAGSWSGNIYTTGQITAACTITINFVLDLTAPNGIEADPGYKQITVSWTTVLNATGYNIYWSTSPSITPSSGSSYIGFTQGVTSTHTMRGLANGTTYYLVVTATAEGTESPASNEVTATTAKPAMPIRLNDTGIIACGNYAFDTQDFSSNHSNSLNCVEVGATATNSGRDVQDNPVPAGQDANFGRDSESLTGTLYKKGGGEAGFDFTKLDANGNELGASATEWSCVRDNRTGLIWEVKVNDSNHLRHQYHTYSWYDSDSATNGGIAGMANGGVCIDSANCDTEKFVAAVNAVRLCGANDWRLPSRQELMSIVHNGRYNPAIDPDYFPNTLLGWVWSSSRSASGGVWCVDFGAGVSYALNDQEGKRVRLVRAGQ